VIGTLHERVADARLTGRPVFLDPGDYPISAPLGLHNVHVRSPEGGVRIFPGEDFVGRALIVGAATSIRGTLLEGLVIDTEGALQEDGEPVRCIDTHRTVVVLRNTTCRGPTRISEHSLSTMDGGSLQNPGGVALYLDDAFLGLTSAKVSGTIVGRGRLGGGGAGLTMSRCVLDQGGGWVALDIAGEDISGFRATLANCRIEGGSLHVGQYGILQLSQVRHVGATTVVLDHWTAMLSASQCLSSGGVVITPAQVVADALASKGLLSQCWKEGSARNGMHWLQPWDVLVAPPLADP